MPGPVLAEHVLDQFNSAIRRLGMYGGQMSLLLYADVLAKAYGQSEQWEEHLAGWRKNGTMNELHVAGPVTEMFGDADTAVIGSVWAQAALDFGWLDLGRVLTAQEYSRARAAIPELCSEDRSLTYVIQTFGRPSVRCGGGNPRYPSTWLYAGPDPEEPLICCHFAGEKEAISVPPGTTGGSLAQLSDEQLNERPSLLAVRVGRGPLLGQFSLTPRGRLDLRASE